MLGEASPAAALPSLDATYEAFASTLPPGLRQAARGLPHRLGVARHPDGGWQELVTLHPNRELPVYAAETSAALAVEPERLLAFVRAHHHGAFSWVVRDRISDGQVVPDAPLLAISRALAEGWQRSLERAAGDCVLVQEVVDQVTRRWRWGVDREREVLRGGGLHPAVYAALVRDKLGWIAAASLCLIASDRAPGAAERRERARAFQRAHDLFLLGLQAIDDVNDADEDRALYGHDVPSALGCTPGALLRVAPKLLRRASAVAGGAGFSRLAFWLTAFARAIAPLHREGDQVADELDAIAIAGEMEQGTEEAAREEGAGAIAIAIASASASASASACVCVNVGVCA